MQAAKLLKFQFNVVSSCRTSRFFLLLFCLFLPGRKKWFVFSLKWRNKSCAAVLMLNGGIKFMIKKSSNRQFYNCYKVLSSFIQQFCANRKGFVVKCNAKLRKVNYAEMEKNKQTNKDTSHRSSCTKNKRSRRTNEFNCS